MPTEGQTAIGPNGERAVFRNGQWVVVGNTPQMPADPTFPYEGPTARENLRGEQLNNEGRAAENVVTTGTARTTIQTNEAPAGTMWVDPNDPSKGVTPIPGFQGERLTPQIRQEAIQAYRDAQAIADTVDSLRRQYYRGPGQTSGIYGLQDYLPTSENRTFDDTGQRARGYVKRALGFTGGEGNTAAEASAIYGPYLPEAGDKDGQIASKIAALEALGRDAEARSIQLLGGIPDEQGNIQPIEQGERLNAMTYLRTDGGVNNERPEAAEFGATEKSVPYPEMGQAEHDLMVGRLIEEGDGRLDPEAYARARAELDRQYLGDSAAPNAEAYRSWAEEINSFLDAGGSTIPTGISPTNQRMSTGEIIGNSIVNNPLGAGAAGYFDAATLGASSALAGRDKFEALQNQRPFSTLGGQVAGAMTGTGAIGFGGRKAAQAVAPKLLGGGGKAQFGRNIGTDVAYGTGYGTIAEGDPVTGAISAGLGSAAGQALGRGIGAAVGGVRASAPAQALRERGIRLSTGRMLGEGASAVEDKMASWPIVGDMIRGRQQDAFEDFNRIAFEEAGKPIGFNPNRIGGEGVEDFRQAVGRAYDDATAGVSVPSDPQFFDDLVRMQASKQRLPDDLQPRVDRLMENHTAPINQTGTMTGEQFQRAMRGLKTARGKAGTVAAEFEQPYREVVSEGMGAFDSLMRRGGGQQVIEGLDRANAANKALKILEDASLDRAKVGTQTGQSEVFLPSQLIAAGRKSEKRFGESGLKALGKQGQEVLPSTVPNSGTADRALVAGAGLAGLGALGGGEAYLQGDVDETSKIAAALAILAAGGTRTGQKAINKAMFDRPEKLKKVGEGIRKRKRLFGSAGVPIVYSSN